MTSCLLNSNGMVRSVRMPIRLPIRLSVSFGIQSGKGLARFLGVKSCFDNHMALRVWVQQRLDDNPDYLVKEMC